MASESSSELVDFNYVLNKLPHPLEWFLHWYYAQKFAKTKWVKFTGLPCTTIFIYTGTCVCWLCWNLYTEIYCD